MAKWQVQEAKAKFSELIDTADHEGPQIITKHGKAHSVVMSIDEFNRLTPRTKDLRELLLGGPKIENFEIERDQDHGRDIDLSDLDVSEYRGRTRNR